MNEEVYVIGGGPSLRGFNFRQLKGHDTIVVNKAIYHVSKPKYFITMDYTFLRKINFSSFKNIQCTKVFITSVGSKYIKVRGSKIVDIRYNIPYDDLCFFNMIINSVKSDYFSKEFCDFRNGMNSGYCAIQLALLLGYDTINLLGFDLRCDGEQTHFHEGYGGGQKFRQRLNIYISKFEQAFSKLPKEFENRIVSRTKNSILNRYIKYKPI